MDEDTKKVQAVLFTTGRFMTIAEIAQAAGLGGEGYVKEKLLNLQQYYQQENDALMITEHEGRWKLNIRKEFGELANKLIGTTELDHPTTKTLAVIAYRNPALQNDIIKIRGNKAYDHIHQLKEEGLITSERSGRTRHLKLTPKFYEYFDTVDASVKELFADVQQKVKETVAAKAGLTPAEVDAREQYLQEQEEREAALKKEKEHESHSVQASSASPEVASG